MPVGEEHKLQLFGQFSDLNWVYFAGGQNVDDPGYGHWHDQSRLGE